MALVKSTEIEFEFPVATVTADGHRYTCRKLDDLELGTPIQVKRGRFMGMELTEASGRRWIVRSVRKIGLMDPWTLWHILFLSRPDWRVEYELEELPPVAPRKARSSAGKGERSPVRESRSLDRDGTEGEADRRSDRTAEAGSVSRGMASDGEVRTVRALETDFQFPVVGFESKEGTLCYSDLFRLTHGSFHYVDDETLVGMELVDNSLRRWIVRSVEPTQPRRKERWWHIWPFYSSDIEFDMVLEPIEPTTLDDLRRRFMAELELDDDDDVDAVDRAPDLAGMFEAAREQGTGLL